MSISPYYSIHRYRDDLYKVVAFKGVRDPDAFFLRDPEENQHYENKLDSNFSRARSMVLQYALCNPWEYFFTGTLDQTKFNRFDLDTYAARLMQFIRDKRKKYNVSFQVLLVPEMHSDGAWHMHGLIHGLPESVLRPFQPPEPKKLIDGGFLNWPDYQEKFGFCSLGSIRDPIATAYYISKYVSKDLARRSGDLGKHLYFHSRPLKKAEKESDIFFPNHDLDKFCTHDYDFCKTGMVENAPWNFPYLWDGVDFPVESFDTCPAYVPGRSLEQSFESFEPQLIDPTYEQSKIPGFR